MAPLTSLPLPTYITEGMDWPLLHWDQEDALNSSSPSDDYPHEALPTMLHASAAKAKARGLVAFQQQLSSLLRVGGVILHCHSLWADLAGCAHVLLGQSG